MRQKQSPPAPAQQVVHERAAAFVGNVHRVDALALDEESDARWLELPVPDKSVNSLF